MSILPTNQEQERARALAQSVDCMTEQDLNVLTGTTSGTTESWRKRGKGPSYILAGNSYLYPRQGVSAWLQSQVRQRSGASIVGKAAL